MSAACHRSPGPPVLGSADHRGMEPPMSEQTTTMVHCVGRAYLDAPRQCDAPETTAAYAQLAEQCSRWFDHLTTGARHPVRVVYTCSRAPYATGGEVRE